MKADKNRAILGLGSDLGDRLGHLENTLLLLNKVSSLTRRSSIYESAAMGFLSEHLFLNMAVDLETHLSASELFGICQEIEQEQLRIKSADGYQDRTLDIDILFYNDEVISNNDIDIPHKGVCERAFVLAPLMEILPGLVHPIEKKEYCRIISKL